MSLNNKLKRKFRRIYDMDLLSVALESYRLGDVVEWDGLIKKPDFGNYSFVNFLRIPDKKKADLKKQLENVKMVKADMSKITIDRSYDFHTGLDIPNFATEVGVEVGNENFSDINIDNVQCKVIARELKFELMQILKQAKEEEKKYYRKELKHLFIINKLFYAGKANLTFKSTTKSNVEAAVLKAKISNPKIQVNNTGEINVSFSGNLAIPFAADIESVKDFMD